MEKAIQSVRDKVELLESRGRTAQTEEGYRRTNELLRGVGEKLRGLVGCSEETNDSAVRKNSSKRNKIDFENEEDTRSGKESQVRGVPATKQEVVPQPPKIVENLIKTEGVDNSKEGEELSNSSVNSSERVDSTPANITFSASGQIAAWPPRYRTVEEWIEESQDEDTSPPPDTNIQVPEERRYDRNPFHARDEVPEEFDRLFLNKRDGPSGDGKQREKGEVMDPAIRAIVEDEGESSQEAMVLYGSYLSAKYNRHKLELSEFQGESYTMYTQEEKRLIIRFATRHGAERASRVMNIHKQKVLRYLDNGERRKKGGGRKILSPQLDSMLLQWIRNHEDDPDSVKSTYKCLQKAKEIAQQIGFENFKGSLGWLVNFRRRHQAEFKFPGVKIEEDKSV